MRVIVEADSDPDTSYLNEDRGAAYKRREFDFLVARVVAEVFIEGTEQILTSPGLAGIESDVDDSEMERIIAEEWTALRDVLKAVGVATKDLPLEVQREWLEGSGG